MNFYSFLIGLGASFGLVCVAVQTAPARRSSALLDGGLIALAGALLGGRGGYVLQNWPHFQAVPEEIPQVWLGGFSGLGALCGGLIGLATAALLLRMAPDMLADSLVPLLPPLVVCAWLACWQSGSAYGAAAPGAWWAIPTRDETGAIGARFPLQPLAAVLTLALFTWIDILRPRLAARGQAASLALGGLALIFAGVNLLRADPAPLWRGLRWDVWGSAALVALSVLFFVLASLRGKALLRITMDK